MVLQNKLQIGLTNDDGIHAEGLLSLARELVSRGHSVRIAAPASNQSAMSHSLTIYRAVKVEKIQLPGEHFREVVSLCVHGTPADSAKVFTCEVNSGWKPDIVISGINSGVNVGLPCVTSGTLSAAREANFCGIPAIAFSTEHSPTNSHYAPVAKLAADLIEKGIAQKLPPLSILNVNIPNVEKKEFKGFRLTRQGHATYNEEYKIKDKVDENLENQMDHQKHPPQDPVNQIWWLSLEGSLIEGENESIDTDFGAVNAGYGSVTPMGPFFQTQEHPTLIQFVQTAFDGL